MKTAKKQTVMGEFGSTCGFTVNGCGCFLVVVVRGYAAEIRALWKELDDCGSGPRQREILSRLHRIGALVTEY